MKTHWVVSGCSSTGFAWKGRDDTVHRDTGALVEAVFGEPNFRHIWWLESALAASRNVARVKLPNGSATGFLVGTDVFMTNNHVFENDQDARSAKLQFDYKMLPDDTVTPPDVWECDPDEMFHTNPGLDYSIVRVKARDGKRVGEARGGWFDLRHGCMVEVNQRVNIIQHPGGRFQEICFRDNQVRAVESNLIQYLTDTDYGSSGSPVFDDWFRVVALHNQRVRDPNDPSRWYRNQGYRVDAILNDVGELIP